MAKKATTTGNGAIYVRKRELFRHIGYQPHAGQVLVHRSKAPRRVLACGVRWGKSVTGAMEAVAALLAPGDQTLGWIVAPSYDNASRIFEHVLAVFRQYFSLRIIDTDLREQRIVVHNLGGGRSELRAKSADNPTSLLGSGLNFLIIDETARLKQSIWDAHLSQRLIDKQGWALLLSTPRGCDWFYRLWKRGQKREAGFESWQSPSSANPHLDASVIEAQRGLMSEELFAQEYEADFAGAQNEPCERCHGPSPDIGGVIAVEGNTPVPKCPECGFSVDANGRSIVTRFPNGEPHVMVIRYYTRQHPVQPPALPGSTEQDRLNALLAAKDGELEAEPPMD